MHVAWMMIAFEGYSEPKKHGHITWVVLSHFGASYATLLNSSAVNMGCVYAILINFVILGASATAVTWSLVKLHKST